MTATTYTFQDGTWQGAEIWSWTDGVGTLIGTANFVNDIGDTIDRCEVRLDNGRRGGPFRYADEAIAWVEQNA